MASGSGISSLTAADGSQTPIEIDRYPDDFQFITFNITPTVIRTPLFLSDRDLVLDRAACRFTAAAGSALTAHIAVCDDAVAMTTNTDVTGDADLNAAANTQQEMAVVPAAAVVKAAALWILELSSGTVGSVANISITLRVRSAKR